jgi:hypothetical protein
MINMSIESIKDKSIKVLYAKISGTVKKRIRLFDLQIFRLQSGILRTSDLACGTCHVFKNPSIINESVHKANLSSKAKCIITLEHSRFHVVLLATYILLEKLSKYRAAVLERRRPAVKRMFLFFKEATQLPNFSHCSNRTCRN